MHALVIVFIEVVTDRNQKNLKQNRFYPSANDPFVASVIFHNAKGTFCLYRAVHSQQCAVNAFKILQHFPVHGGQLFIDPHRSVLGCLLAFRRVWAAGAIFAFVDLFLSPVLITLYGFR